MSHPRFLVLGESTSLWHQAISVLHLAMEITRADLYARQFQRFLGPVWWITEPALMSLAFFFLTERMNYSTGANHFMFIFIGLTVWRFFQRTVESSTLAYVGYTYVIRQISFPLIAVNIATLFSELIYFGCGLLFIFAYGGLMGKLAFGWSYLFLPALVLSQCVITLAVVLFVAITGVYVRDLPQPLSLALAVAFFLSPGIYAADNLPRALAFMPWVNPFYYYFPAYRGILLDDRMSAVAPLLAWTLIGLAALAMGLWWYGKVRPHLLRVL